MLGHGLTKFLVCGSTDLFGREICFLYMICGGVRDGAELHGGARPRAQLTKFLVRGINPLFMCGLTQCQVCGLTECLVRAGHG
jgi:hypothetical protein